MFGDINGNIWEIHTKNSPHPFCKLNKNIFVPESYHITAQLSTGGERGILYPVSFLTQPSVDGADGADGASISFAFLSDFYSGRALMRFITGCRPEMAPSQ